MLTTADFRWLFERSPITTSTWIIEYALIAWWLQRNRTDRICIFKGDTCFVQISPRWRVKPVTLTCEHTPSQTYPNETFSHQKTWRPSSLRRWSPPDGPAQKADDSPCAHRWAELNLRAGYSGLQSSFTQPPRHRLQRDWIASWGGDMIRDGGQSHKWVGTGHLKIMNGDDYA